MCEPELFRGVGQGMSTSYHLVMSGCTVAMPRSSHWDSLGDSEGWSRRPEVGPGIRGRDDPKVPGMEVKGKGVGCPLGRGQRPWLADWRGCVITGAGVRRRRTMARPQIEPVVPSLGQAGNLPAVLGPADPGLACLEPWHPEVMEGPRGARDVP